jgi:hypothetical protein
MKTIIPLLFTTCVITSFYYPPDALEYRSAVSSGDWSAAGSWEVWTGGWTPAAAPPGPEDAVTIRSGHAVIINLVDAAAASVIVENGAVLRLQNPSLGLSIFDGGSGADFVVEGIFEDHGSSGSGNGVIFQAGATWRLEQAGTIIKTNNSGAARYRDNYEGGMQTIPPNANWIVRYIGLSHPTFTTNDTYYPNLTFESHAGHWIPSGVGNFFQGVTATAVIYGNLDVGGGGSGTVTMINENRFSDPILIHGQCIVRAGSTLNNGSTTVGTGFEVKGNLTVDGVLDLSLGSGLLRMSGAGPQIISGSGSILLQDMEVITPNDVSLQRDVEVKNNLTLSAGKVTLNLSDLTVRGFIYGASDNRFIQTNAYGPEAGGLVLSVGGSTFFPVGNSSYNPLILNNAGFGDFKVRVEDVVWSQGTQGDPLFFGIVGRSWMIEGFGGSMGATVQWKAGEERPGFDRSQCYISRFQGGGWIADDPGPASGGGPYTRSLSGFLSPAVLAVASGGILPVELTFFHARREGSQAVLEWQTATEQNNDYFAVERSSDGRRYEEISRIPGRGQSHEHQNYSFIDAAPPAGVNYYRLRQVDYDGSATYSPVRAVEIPEDKQAVALASRIVHDALSLQWRQPLSYPGRLTIADRSGRLVFGDNLPAGVNQHRIDVANLPKGFYLAHITVKERGFVEKFIKP